MVSRDSLIYIYHMRLSHNPILIHALLSNVAFPLRFLKGRRSEVDSNIGLFLLKGRRSEVDSNIGLFLLKGRRSEVDSNIGLFLLKGRRSEVDSNLGLFLKFDCESTNLRMFLSTHLDHGVAYFLLLPHFVFWLYDYVLQVHLSAKIITFKY